MRQTTWLPGTNPGGTPLRPPRRTATPGRPWDRSAGRRPLRVILSAIALAGAAGLLLLPRPAQAGSCCGGGGGAALILPESIKAALDLSFDWEKYDGFWNTAGEHLDDPPGSDLNQYRVNLSGAWRLSPRWQVGGSVPYVWNSNVYSGTASHTDGLGDSTVSFWYEALRERSVWKIQSLSDLTPSVTVGASLLIPTGISPYDDVESSFDVTGRGFYRIDGNVQIDKGYMPWNVSASLSYGTYIERSVNREYGKYVQPFDKDLGDRFSSTLSLGYKYFLGTAGDSLTGTASWSYLHEGDGTVDGKSDPSVAFRKNSVGFALLYSSTDHDWSVRASWNHAIMRDGYGANFPTTDILSVGVRYAFR